MDLIYFINYHLCFRIVDVILETTVKVLNEQDEISNTALHLAAEGGHVDIVETLINIGANKESR